MLNRIQSKNRAFTAPIEAQPGWGVSAQDVEDKHNLPLRTFLQVIRRRFWFIIFVTVVLVGTIVGLSMVQTPVYEASIKILVGQERVSRLDSPREDVVNLQKMTQTMAEGVNSRRVAEAVIQELNLSTDPEDFLENLRIEQIPETQFITVSYRDPSPERAQEAANTIGDVFARQVSEVNTSSSAITATVWEQAPTPDEPASPKPIRNGLLTLLLGLMLGTGLAFLVEYMNDSWRSPEEVEEISGRPTFGIIPEFEVLTSKKQGKY